MKKILLILCALLLTGIGAWAQGQDVDFTSKTSTTDASLWTGQGSIGLKEWGIEAYAGDAQTFSSGNVLTQTIYGLPAGEYTVKFKAFAKVARRIDVSRGTGTNIAYGYAQVGSTTQTKTLTIPGSLSPNYSEDDWEEVSFTVTLTDGEALEYGIQNTEAAGQWYGISDISLTHSGALTARELEDGDVVEECEAEFGHWSISGNTSGELELNTWSYEADASGVVKPFIEYYIGAGSELSPATISHYDIMCLPKGYYKVSVLARAYNEGNTTTKVAEETIYFKAGSDSVDIVSHGTEAVYNGVSNYVYGTYEIICHLEEKGVNTLDSICFIVKEGSSCDWLSWKNLKVEYIGEDMVYTIGDPECSAMVAVPGGTVDIVFNDCLSPGIDTATENTPTLSTTVKIKVNETEVEVDATALSNEGFTNTVTITIPDNIDADVVVIEVPEGLIYWDISSQDNVLSPEGKFTLTTPPLKDGEYLIVNTENGYYFGGGLKWGTQATQLTKPQFIKLEEQKDGTYKLDSHQYNSATNHYLGADLYLDSSTPVDWVIVHSEDGYAIYNAAAGGYLTGNGFQKEVSAETTIGATAYWNFLTMDDVVKSMEDASVLAPVDVTALIKAPEMKRNSNSEYDTTWTVKGYNETEDAPSNYAFGGGSATANCAESYHSSNGFNFSQTITLPKAGTYTLSAQGFYDGTAASADITPVMYAGDDTYEFSALTDGTITSMASAYQAFLEETYPVGTITIQATKDKEEVTIGFKGNNTALWVIMGELELLYLGEVETVNWTMTSAGWGTMILPFDAEIPTGEDGNAELTLYAGDKITVNDSELELKENATTIAANTPYLVMSNIGIDDIPTTGITYTFSDNPTNTEDTYTVGLLTGTFVYMSLEDGDFTADSGQYLLQDHGDGAAFYQVTDESENVSLSPYHCYLTIEAEEDLHAPSLLSLGRFDDATGIVAVESETLANDAIYDLSGRKVSKAVKGVYIMNGKKVLVK